MLIRVKYPNGTYDMVKDQLLDYLLKEDKIAGFKRSEGWAFVGVDPIRQRSRQSESHYGTERRGTKQHGRNFN